MRAQIRAKRERDEVALCAQERPMRSAVWRTRNFFPDAAPEHFVKLRLSFFGASRPLLRARALVTRGKSSLPIATRRREINLAWLLRGLFAVFSRKQAAIAVIRCSGRVTFLKSHYESCRLLWRNYVVGRKLASGAVLIIIRCFRKISLCWD